MMKTYRVERMTEDNYSIYMEGGYGYNMETLHIEAETAEEAAKKAEAVGYVVNKGYVKTLEELEAERKAAKERAKEAERKATKAAQKRRAAEEKKAAALGMTVKEYRAEKAKKANIARVEREIAELEEALAKKKEYLAKIKG